VAGCKFPRLQLRGSAGFSPASLLVKANEDAQTKEVVKELNLIVEKIYSPAARKSIIRIDPAGNFLPCLRNLWLPEKGELFTPNLPHILLGKLAHSVERRLQLLMKPFPLHGI
jgi:hypothetical protein